MKLLKLNKEIEILEDICKSFLENPDKIDKSDITIDNMALKVKAFDEIINECKEELDNADEEHMERILKLLYGLETINNADNSLDSYVSKQIDNQEMQVNENRIKSIKSIIANVEAIICDLILTYKNTLHMNKKFLSFKGRELKKYEELLKRLVDLKRSLEKQLEEDSKKISSMIINDFYNLYIFFAFLINLSIKRQNELLLIEIASKLDRYIEVIEPSFSDRFLHHNDMLYHYAVYEIKELKGKIFTFLK